MVIARLTLFVVPVKAGSRRHINLTAEYGLNARRLGRLIKIDHAVHDAVVGHGERRLSQVFCALNELRYLSGAVKQRIFRVYVQMCECH